MHGFLNLQRPKTKLMDYVKRRARAEAFFRSRWRDLPHEDASDFGAYCVEQWLSGRNPDTRLLFMAIDFLRKFNNVNKDRGSRDALSQSFGRSNFSEVHEIGESSSDIKRYETLSLISAAKLSSLERGVLMLFYKWGLTTSEIGYCFGVSESRVSQIKSGAEKKMRKASRGTVVEEKQ